MGNGLTLRFIGPSLAELSLLTLQIYNTVACLLARKCISRCIFFFLYWVESVLGAHGKALSIPFKRVACALTREHLLEGLSLSVHETSSLFR
jgi:hypothetical protein